METLTDTDLPPAKDRQGVTTLGKPWPKNVRTALLNKCPQCKRETHPNTCSTYCENCGEDLIKRDTLEAWIDQSGREIVGRPEDVTECSHGKRADQFCEYCDP